MGGDAEPPADRRPDRRAVRLLRGGRAGDPPSPRAMRRLGLTGRPPPGRDSPRRPDPPGGRRPRSADVGPAAMPRAAARDGGRDTPGRRRDSVVGRLGGLGAARISGPAPLALRARPRRSTRGTRPRSGRVEGSRRRRARRGLPREPSPRLGLAHRRSPGTSAAAAGDALRAGVRRRRQRARRRVLLPRRALQPRATTLVVRRRRYARDRGVRVPVPDRSVAADEGRARRRRDFLPGAARRHQLLAPLVVGEPRPGAAERADLLRRVPRPGPGMIGLALALAVVTALIALVGEGPASLLRHAYLPPVVAAGLRFG